MQDSACLVIAICQACIAAVTILSSTHSTGNVIMVSSAVVVPVHKALLDGCRMQKLQKHPILLCLLPAKHMSLLSYRAVHGSPNDQLTVMGGSSCRPVAAAHG